MQLAPLRRRAGTALVVAAALVGTAACGSTAPVTAATPSTTTAAPVTVPPPPPPPPPVLWPLTGLVSGPVPAHPALAVKIENSTAARPQTGLAAADMVWEQVVEGGITRFVAVYHSTLPPEIGPVRSVRPMDPAIARPLRGLFAFSGGQAGYVSAVADAGMQVLSLDAGDAGFHRTSDRSAPHNVYASPAELLAQADPEHLAPPAAQFAIAPTAQQASPGTPATSLQLTLSRFATPRWTWDPVAGLWYRAEGDTPAREPDGTPVGTTNVVVMRVDVVDSGGIDPAGNPVPETVLVGSGEALVAVGGATVPATWTKPDSAAPVALTGTDGLPVRLAPGTTWVELVPNGSGDVAVG